MPYGGCSKASDPHPQSYSRTSGSVSRTGPQPMRSAPAATYVGSRARTGFGPFPFSLLTDCVRSTTNATSPVWHCARWTPRVTSIEPNPGGPVFARSSRVPPFPVSWAKIRASAGSTTVVSRS